jgi:amidohydrolase
MTDTRLKALKARVGTVIDELADDLVQASDYLAAHPEIGHHEFKAVELLTGILQKHGIESEVGLAGMPTAFRADLDSNNARPRIAILGEYDALPDIGHGCGHNLIATSALGAALAVHRVLPELGGSAVLIGTPCEESTTVNAGGKVPLAEAGFFDDVDAAIMMHPGTLTMVSTNSSLAARGFDFEFAGRSAHAAARPHDGINALDGVILLYNGVNALRQHLRSDVRIHGIVTDGGAAANVVPEHAACRFRVRSESVDYLDEVVEKVISCAKGAASMTGAELSWREYANPYWDYIPNKTLAKLGEAMLSEAGLTLDVAPSERGMGSTDLGNVSHKTPSVTLRVAIGDPGLRSHSRDFADATVTSRGHQALLSAAKALAMMAVTLIEKPDLAETAQKELEDRLAARNGLEAGQEEETHAGTRAD